MPAQTKKSAIAQKFGNRLNQSVKAHAQDETTAGGFSKLPGGITSGIAQLESISFDEHKDGRNKGNMFCRMVGVVVSPATAPDGTPIRGLQTSIFEPLYDTANAKGEMTDFDAHVGNILNSLRLLGAEEAVRAMQDGAEIEGIAAALVEAAPYFRFDTSVGQATPQYPTPRVFENWRGTKGLEDYTPDSVPDVQDDTGKQQDNGQAATAQADEAPADDDQSAVTSEDDLDSLVERADADDQQAKDALTAQAGLVGIGRKEVEGMDSWGDVAAVIRDKANADTEPAEWVPAVEEVYKFTVIDPKTKKPAVDSKTKKARKPIDVEVTAVNDDKQTVSVKSLDDPKVKYTVAWDKLIKD